MNLSHSFFLYVSFLKLFSFLPHFIFEVCLVKRGLVLVFISFEMLERLRLRLLREKKRKYEVKVKNEKAIEVIEGK